MPKYASRQHVWITLDGIMIAAVIIESKDTGVNGWVYRVYTTASGTTEYRNEFDDLWVLESECSQL